MAFNKWNRNYVLRIEPFDAPAFTISRPFTLEFDISRNNFASANYAQIRVFNLSQYHRNLIRHDVTDQNAYKPLNVTLYAGYGNGPIFPVIFSGNAQAAWSHREGVNFITTIEAFDGGAAIQNAHTSLAVASGTPIQNVIGSVLADLSPYGVKTGVVAPFDGAFAKGFGLSGNTAQVLGGLTNNSFFIDQGIANVLPKGFAIGTQPIVTLNSQTGLLNTPFSQQSIIDLQILFEPRLIVGSTIKLESNASQAYNGIHQVVGITHRGIISEAVSGEAVTSIRALGGVFTGLASQFIH